MPGEPSASEEVRTAELVAALSLATDLGIGLPLEHGLQSTLCAMRLCDELEVDGRTATQTYYGCLLFYIGCTADAEVNAELFDEGALLEHFNPVMFASRLQTATGVLRALAGAGAASPWALAHAAARLPTAARGHRRHLAAICEVAQMLTARLGLPGEIGALFQDLTERWDGKGEPGDIDGEELPLALRIVHVARDATLQQLIGGDDHAARVVAERSGHAFDPAVADVLAANPARFLSGDGDAGAWAETLAREPRPHLLLDGNRLDRALAAMADFTDLLSPYLVGHSSGVATLAATAARRSGMPEDDVVSVHRAGLVHDLGRVAVPARVWQKVGPLTPDEWERVRLHAYHSERVLCRSPFLARLAPTATAHHERADGSGYHRAATAAALSPPARLLAAADAYHAMTEPRPYRAPLSAGQAAEAVVEEAGAGRLDRDAVAAVLDVAGHRAPVPGPAGLTRREVEVVALLARGLQTKQVARRLDISVKTADHHVQNAYRKIGISTRAAAALFAMEHGLTRWGELPIVSEDASS